MFIEFQESNRLTWWNYFYTTNLFLLHLVYWSCCIKRGFIVSESGNTITKIQKHCASTLSHISDSLIIKKPCDNFRISSCGNFILFTRDTRVRVINTCTCATFTRFTHDTDLCATALHPTRNIAAVADVDGRICFLNDWNVKVCLEYQGLFAIFGNLKLLRQSLLKYRMNKP